MNDMKENIYICTYKSIADQELIDPITQTLINRSIRKTITQLYLTPYIEKLGDVIRHCIQDEVKTVIKEDINIVRNTTHQDLT